MKISALEKILLAITAALLLFMTGYFLGAHGGAEPYRVEAQLVQEATETLSSGTASPEISPGVSPKVNINTASAAELETLPGIGEKRAADIIADREANGPFRVPEDITRVSGIGEGTLAGLIDYITVE